MITYKTPFYKRTWFIILALALVLALGVGIGTSLSEREPTKEAPAKVVEKTPSPSAEPKISDDELLDLIALDAWNKQSAEDQEDMCFAYLLDPEMMLDAAVEGGGEDAREPFRRLLDRECATLT